MKAFTNCTVEPVIGSVIPNGTVLVSDDGKIADIGENVIIPSGAQIFDLSGLYITPGLVDAHTHLGVFPYCLPQSMNDGNEKTDPVTPAIRAIDSFSPQDEAVSESLSGGVTCVQILPGSANLIGGTGAVIKLNGSVVDKMIVKAPSVMKAALGENPLRVYGHELKKTPSTRMGAAAMIRQTLANAVTYRDKLAKGEAVDRDLGLEALVPVIEGKMNLSVHCHRADDICTAIRIAKEFGLHFTLEHCTDGALIVDYLAENHVFAAIGPTFGGKGKPELAHKSFNTPAILWRAGVHFCIITDHPVIPLVHATISATLAMNAGLPRDVAIKAITLFSAEHIGMADRIGSLETGKDADIAVWTGDPLDARNHCVLTVIDGRIVYDGRG